MSDLVAAARFALAEMEQARPVTFLIVWETGDALTVRTWPPSQAVLSGLLQMLCEAQEPESDDDDDD